MILGRKRRTTKANKGQMFWERNHQLIESTERLRSPETHPEEISNGRATFQARALAYSMTWLWEQEDGDVGQVML